MNVLEARRRLLGAGVYKKTVTGNPAVAQGSLARMYPGIEMQGWTEQAQYEGKNLFDKSGIVVTGEVQYIPVNVGDGEFTLSTQYNNTDRKDVFFLPGNVSAGANSSDNGVTLNKPVTVTSENGYVTVALRINSEEDMNPLDYNIMLNSGSTALPYEPYTGGKPSPNPDYPQEIVSAGNWNEDTGKYEYGVEVTGANLIPEYFDESKWDKSRGTYWCIPVSGLKTGELYTFSTVLLPEKGLGIYVLLGSVAGDGGSGETHWLYHRSSEGRINESVTFEATRGTYYLNLYLEDGGSFNTFINLFPELMLELGDKRTTYEPYRPPQTVTLTSDRPLTKWDGLEKRNGQWGWVYGSNTVEFNGTEEWDINVNYENVFRHNEQNMQANSEVYSDSYKQILTGLLNESDYGISTGTYVNIKNKNATTIEEFKALLQFNPITVLYQLAEPVFVPLSASEQEQMNALHTNRPTTVLSNDADCEMTLTYKTKKSLEVTD